ncbi:hypothetical protein OG302_37575 [Streptomyces sp. NBC_01283]|uniref:hypothetical protein n=1 Tax=Streptomyces sp. NBC_01283 TaxID=2903812 RepID=UPI00352EAA84|nr:hypothetical protein OG302_37575 [Streptomyces sp. NBC_01283]
MIEAQGLTKRYGPTVAVAALTPREVGALLEARTFHPGRTEASPLAALAAAGGVARSLVAGRGWRTLARRDG